MQNSQNKTIPALLDYRGLEEYFGLKKSTISKLVMTGGFTNIVKVGRKNFFRVEDVQNWINSKTIQVV